MSVTPNLFCDETEPRSIHSHDSPITSQHIDGETMKIVTDIIFSGSKFTVDGDCSHEIRRCCAVATRSGKQTHSEGQCR